MKQMHELKQEYIKLMDASPPDTGMPIGVRRTDHCRGRKVKCSSCKAWEEWERKVDELVKQMKARKALGDID
jgi:hypothetical protein